MGYALSAILLFNITGCSNVKSNSNDKDSLKNFGDSIALDSSFLKKVQLMETVLNLPSVIKFSKLELIRKTHSNVCIYLNASEFNNHVPAIIQNGRQLQAIHSIDSIRNQPCYVFAKMQIDGSTAYVQMIFDITGLLAFGKLNYVGNHWMPDQEFKIGVR